MENLYQDKYDEFLRNVFNLNFVFEVTKCCGYSTFITAYKNQTIMDLYSNIVNHFGNIQIRELFFISPQNERIQIPISNQKLSDFIRSHIVCNPPRLVPVYNLPKPVIYKIYFDDGHCTEEHCSLVHYHII
jgi:hypothetical protein